MNNIVNDVNQRLAAIIRHEREVRHWSQQQLAAQAGVSRAMVQKIEQGASSPTATLLARLAGAFGLSISTLIARAERTECQLLTADQQPVWQDPASGYLRRHLSPEGILPLDLVEITLPAHQQVTLPAAAYRGASHYIWLLAGVLNFTQGTTQYRLKEGDCLLLSPQPEVCTFASPAETACRYLVVRVGHWSPRV